jgi:uncharacterized tellurite resistance protein B-like protein
MTDELTAHQKRMLMELLISLAKSDGKVGEIENEAIEDYAELMDVPLEELSGSFTIAELTPHFDTPASRVAVIEELCRMARLDGRLGDSEQGIIIDVAHRLGISPDLVTRIDDWVVDGMRWMARGEDLIADAERQLA